ncbi:DUF4362 domain-containing protein [Bacillus sp. B-jedd]|uniref:DUF4362 domain-containing protein n=1 Tax=Bacillus sp. B-jedd TaxID=1476857 RepID=UPI0005156FED|nr:DUF4362 domain-containing protein [Bacillus sp. B-jedd]CEG26217.1 hypothetical protein BN1002_01059 [Bacillus sp. B-jedd]
MNKYFMLFVVLLIVLGLLLFSVNTENTATNASATDLTKATSKVNDIQTENIVMMEILKRGLRDYNEVVDAVANHLETRVSIEVYTVLKGDDKSASMKAIEIKEKAIQIITNNKSIKIPKDRYFIYVYDHNGDDLIESEYDDALIPEIHSFGKKLTNKIPRDYSKAMALKNGDITPTSITKKQRDKIERFMENVKNKKPDFIRFTQFTSFGHAVITEYQFNGKLIYYRSDSSRDKLGQLRKGKSDVYEDYCKQLVPDSIKSYLTNCLKSKTIEF